MRDEERALETTPAAAPSPAEIEQWKARHGEAYVFESDELVVYCRKPGRAEIARFTKEVQRDLYRASWNLLVACLLHPSAEVLQQHADHRPGIVVSLAGELTDVAGVTLPFLSRKL